MSDGELSNLHLAYEARLREWGYEPEHEVVFEPYRVDVYLKEAHVAVEVDGPVHGSSFRGRDRRRDRLLLERYRLPTLRVRPHQLDDKELVLVFVQRWSDDARERRLEAERAKSGLRPSRIDWGPR